VILQSLKTDVDSNSEDTWVSVSVNLVTINGVATVVLGVFQSDGVMIPPRTIAIEMALSSL
jgi:hypothetical protein